MTSPRVQRHRNAEAARRRVRTVGTSRIGQQTRIPKPVPPKKRKPYRKSGALSALSFALAGLFFATGQVFWAVGACAGAAGSAAAWRIDYRRELAQVKATGRPIGGAQPKPQKASATPARQRTPKPKPGADHLARCKAKPPGGPTCRCADGPNRKGAKQSGKPKRRGKRP